MFFSCANLHAQVTIGGLEEPKAGAVLDLNSTTKGGLLLSNVSIEDFFKIPSTFHGGGGEDAALKEGLTGAMIYNTNPAFCIGVHVWNGQHWGRIATTTPVSAPGALSIPSGAANLIGGDEVEFTASSGAKTYRWFAGKNDAPYEYLGITTTSTYAETFPAGVGRMKVIMDDCRSVKESELSFSMGSVSPNFGSLAGGNYVYIYGDFPYAATDDYEQDGLVAHYDGINNTGQGDKYHSLTATSWVNLVDPSLPLNVTGTVSTAGWTSSGWRDDVGSLLQTPTVVPDTWPEGNEPRTAEIIYITPPYELPDDTEAILFRYGPMYQSSNDAKKGFYISYRGGVNRSFLPIAIADYNNFLEYAKSRVPALYEANTLHTVTSTYGNNMNDPATTNMLIDGFKVNESYMRRSNAVANTVRDFGKVGADGSTGGTLIHDFLYRSVRLYDRILTDEEIARNAERDRKRYIAPPGITIDGIPCTEVVVLSSRFLMCKIPESITGTGAKDIVINVTGNTVTYTGAYEYADPVMDFYVSGICM